MNKYLARLKSEKRPSDVLPKLPKGKNSQGDVLPKVTKGGYGSYVSAEGRRISEKLLEKSQKNNPPEPEWQYNFCTAHADFNHWRGSCPRSIDDCLLSKLIDTGEDLDKMRGFEIGKGITTDEVIDEWLRSNEPAADLINQPAWFVCMAEYLVNGTEDDKENAI